MDRPDQALAAAAALAHAGDHAAAIALLEASLPRASGDLAAAVRLALANSLGKLGRNRDASAVLSRDLVEGGPTANLLALAEASRLAGDVPAARRVLAVCRGRENLGASAIDLERQDAECALLEGDGARAAAKAEGFLASGMLSGADRVAFLLLLGRIRLAGSEYKAGAEHFAEGRRQAALLGDSALEVRAGINEAICLLNMGDLTGAARGFRDAGYLASVLGLGREEAGAAENLAVLEHMRRRYGPALEQYRRALGLLDGIGNPEYLARVSNNIGELMLRLGDPVGAREQLEHGARISAAAGGDLPAVRGERALLTARIEIALGHTTDAAAAIEDAKRIYSKLDEPGRLAEIVGLEAERLVCEGAHSRAHDLVRGRTPLLARFPRHHARALLVAADALAARGSDPRASLERAAEIARTLEDDELVWRAHFRLARYYLSTHRIDDARRAEAVAKRAESRIRQAAPPEFAARMDRMPERAALRALSRRLTDSEAAGTHAHVPAAGPAASPPPLVAASPLTRDLLDRARRVARSDAAILLTGETGVGKDRIAQEIHEASGRRAGPFLKVSCGAMVESLLLSELLGHERGAFTGAVERRAGWFEAASGGTLFLDEIGETSPRTQSIILRVLEEGRVTRIGGTAPTQVDVRVVFATNRPIEEMVRAGSFRADLYYRVRPMRLHVPSLAERPEDVPGIARAVVERDAAGRQGNAARSLAPETLAFLSRQEWPGNVRELENVVQAALTLSSEREIRVEHVLACGALSAGRCTPASPFARGLGATLAAAADEVLSGRRRLGDVMDRIRGALIERAFAASGGNVAAAARLLGMSRPKLAESIRRMEIAGSPVSHGERPGMSPRAGRSERRSGRPGGTKGVRS